MLHLPKPSNLPRFPKKLLLAPAAFFLLCALHIYQTNRNFETFTETMFLEEIQSNTLNLHYTLENPSAYGITDYPITLGSAKPEVLEASAQTLEQDYQTLQTFSYRALTGENQLTYDILNVYLENQLQESQYLLYAEPLGATIGTQAQLPILLAEYAFYEKSDVIRYLKLLQQMDVYYATLLDYEKAKSAAGLFMSDKNLDAILTQCRSFIETPDKNVLITIFPEKVNAVADLTAQEKELLISKNRQIVQEHVIPAYELLITGLESLRGTGTTENGLCYLPQGKEYYACLVRDATGCQVSVSTIQNRIQEQIFADYEALRTLITENPQVLEELRAVSAASPQDPAAILNDLQAKMAADFPQAPNVSCQIKYVDASLEEYLSPAFYLTPPIDNLTDNVIYINQASGYTSAQLYTTLAHEGYPGHLYQTVYSGSFESNPVRNLLNFSGYVEGWATYVEMMSWEYTGLSAELAEAYRLNRSISLGFSSLIDIAVHYKGYTREKVVEYLTSFGYNASSASALFDAVIESPANYLKYYVGALSFQDLQTAVKEKEGEQFSLREFHAKVLEIGPAPFSVLAKYLL
ncbi:MAG: DUF885 domain-containing protein [Eubacteriales bacterium]|nr:DUF885 domain-containing protein [Eubacteriales bacterium]